MEYTGSGDNTAVYGLNYAARALASRLAEKEAHQFLVGTHSLKEKNEVHVIEYKEESEQVECMGVYSHPGEIWQLRASSSNKDLFGTIYTDKKEKECRCSLWQLTTPPPNDGAESAVDESQNVEQLSPLRHVGDLKGHTGPITALRWSVLEEGEETGTEAVATLDSKNIRWWNLDKGADTTLDEKRCMKSPEITGLTAGCFDPHHEKIFVAASKQSISCWDFRANKPGVTVTYAHLGKILDLDFNPNHPYHVLSCGEDMLARFWDIRKEKQPLLTLGGHTHWIWSVRFNRYHDQLVLTSGTDSNVNLWSVVSCSSAPMGELFDTGDFDEEKKNGGKNGEEKREDTTTEKEGDKLIKRYEGHRDSVYAIAWSSDAWVFASLSFDGTVVVNNVPQSEKYKILL